MTTWRCRHCELEVTCLGRVEGHRCPRNRSKWTTAWDLVATLAPEGAERPPKARKLQACNFPAPASESACGA
jgi:hypothetical protein